jgi:hypothetical protein
MDNQRLASLRKEFRVLLNKHDSDQFRFIVEMLYHSEELPESNYEGELWKASVAAVDILYEVDADLEDVYAWRMKSPKLR